MPSIFIQVKERPDFKFPTFTEAQMRQLGDLADDLMDLRVDSAQPRNIFGEPRPDLSEKYARKKQREGRRPVRDMRRTGGTLDAKNVLGTFSNEQQVGATVGIKGSTFYWRGLKAQNVDPWFGMTPEEEDKIRARAEKIFAANVSEANAK